MIVNISKIVVNEMRELRKRRSEERKKEREKQRGRQAGGLGACLRVKAREPLL